MRGNHLSAPMTMTPVFFVVIYIMVFLESTLDVILYSPTILCVIFLYYL